MTAPIVFGLAGWCRLLAHACTIPDCPCGCHTRRATPRPSTALHRAAHSGDNPPASYGPTDSVLRVGAS